MLKLVVFATSWGTAHGGINSFNQDFCAALSTFAGPKELLCVVLGQKGSHSICQTTGVQLLQVRENPKVEGFDEIYVDEVLRSLQKHGCTHGPSTWWIGHDVHTGGIACKIAEATSGRSAAIMHMSYFDYICYRDSIGSGAKTLEKDIEQRNVFYAANCTFAVGPLLFKRLQEILLERNASPSGMIVPGFPSITPLEAAPARMRVITFGRLGAKDDRIKLGSLAVAAASKMIGSARVDGEDSALRNGAIVLFGCDLEQEKGLFALARKHAGREVNVIPCAFTKSRDALFDELRRSSVAMMLSWHEGFGLAGWEAIAAGVPLIVSANSGLYELLVDELGAAASTLAGR